MKVIINEKEYGVNNISIVSHKKCILLENSGELEATEPFPDLSELLPLTEIDSAVIYDDNGQVIDFGVEYSTVESVASFFVQPRSFTYTITLNYL